MNCFDKQINNEQLAAIAAAEIPFEFTNQLKMILKLTANEMQKQKTKRATTTTTATRKTTGQQVQSCICRQNNNNFSLK